MDLRILGCLIGVAVAFMFYVLFKLNDESRRKNHPKPGFERPQPSSPAVEKPGQMNPKSPRGGAGSDTRIEVTKG